MIAQYSEWMRDNWNHPSVAIWDAQNETRADELSSIIARRARRWISPTAPGRTATTCRSGPDDPVEDHPYLFSRLGNGFEIADTGAHDRRQEHQLARIPPATPRSSTSTAGCG